MSELDSANEIRFHALRNAIYHTSRRRWFEAFNRVGNFVIILLGTAGAAQVVNSHAGIEGAAWLGFATAVTGAMMLVFDFGGRARTHQTLQSKYYEVLAQSEEIDDDDKVQIRRLAGSLVRMYADEPPTAQIPDALAYNATCQALGGDPKDQMSVSVCIRFAAIFLPFVTFKIDTYREIEEKKLQKR